MRPIAVVFSLVFFSCPALAQLPADCAQRLPDRMTYEHVQAKIQRCRLRTADSVLALFPPTFLSNYVLMHSARGRQQASIEAPRAILYGLDASLVVAFNGDPRQRAFEDLEFMQFRRDTKTFEFRRITFPEGAAANLPEPVFSAANPMECAGCHRRDNPRPNWDGHLLWPGSFGAEDDFIFRRDGSTATEDGKRFALFWRIGKPAGRYRHLATVRGPAAQLPNEQLGALMGALNAEKIAHELARDPRTRPFRHALMGAAVCSPTMPIDSFLPPIVRSRARNPLARVIADMRENHNESFRNRFLRLRDQLPGVPETPRVRQALGDIERGAAVYGENEVAVVAAFRFLVEEVLGLPMRQWSLELASRNYVFADGGEGLARVRAPLAEEMFRDDPRVLTFARGLSERRFSANPRATAEFCESLRQRSLSELGAP